MSLVANATAQSPRNAFCNVIPPYLPPDCHMDSMCDKLHPSLPLVLQVVCWKLFHTSACCTLLVLTMLTWENIRSTHAEECGNATSVHISSDRTSNFGLALQSVICFSSSQNAGGSISYTCRPISHVFMPSVLRRCWLGGRKGIRPVKKLSGEVLVWLSVWSEVQTCIWPSWCHCHSLSLASVKSRLIYLSGTGSPG